MTLMWIVQLKTPAPAAQLLEPATVMAVRLDVGVRVEAPVAIISNNGCNLS